MEKNKAPYYKNQQLQRISPKSEKIKTKITNKW